ncbi:nitrate regulatory gene2 protein [Eutrema salsugineum]|uniref:nitrate regulatory gene2 protein n=1 Tax=Eutrema salsugineum TaxID=72664 RepID=UPI000CED545E|nr:nitrate regulatory gene2 protein [Eutrema salsugineum]
MGIVASKGDNNTPLLNLCKERKELIRAVRDARYHLSKSHLLYFRSLSDFSNALNQFVHKDLVVIPYSSDDDSSSSELKCCGSDSDSDSDSDCLVCDRSQTGPLSNNDDQNQPKPASGGQACESSNNVQEGMEKPSEGLGFVENEFLSVPVEDSKNCSSIGHQQQNRFMGPDIFGLYDYGDNTQSFFIEPDQRDDEDDESDAWREVREREGIPDLEPDSDYHDSLVRKNQKKTKKKKKKCDVKESSSIGNVSGEVESNVEANTCNGQVSGEANDSNEACAQETEKTPEVVTEVTRSDEEVCDESSSSETSCSGLNDLRNVVEKINCICKKAVSYSGVSELLEVSKVVHHQPLGSQLKGFASRVLGSSKNSTRDSLSRRGLREENLAVSLSVTLEKLYMWETKLYAEVTVEEKLRVLYDKGYKILKSLDQNGAESRDIYEAEAMVKLHLSRVNVSVRAVESVSMRIHTIRDEELTVQVIEMINGFKEMWRFLAKCHHKQFLAISRSKSCVHIVEKGSSSRKATHKVEENIRRFRESLRGYIDAHRGFVRLLNEWLNRNIMEEDDQTEIEAPKIFRVCSEWLREIENVDETKLLSVVEEMESRFRGLGLKQVEEEKQRMRTERLCKELERQTKEAEEILGTAVVFPASDSTPTEEMMIGPELLSLRESVTQEREKHERVMMELNDNVSMTLQERLVPVFEALEEFCFSNFNAYQNIRIVSTEETLLLCQQ